MIRPHFPPRAAGVRVTEEGLNYLHHLQQVRSLVFLLLYIYINSIVSNFSRNFFTERLSPLQAITQIASSLTPINANELWGLILDIAYKLLFTLSTLQILETTMMMMTPTVSTTMKMTFPREYQNQTIICTLRFLQQ